MSKHHMEKVTCPFCHHEGVDIDNMYEFASSHCDDFKDLRDDEDIVINREWSLIVHKHLCNLVSFCFLILT